jgi:hypothetical protein
VKSYNQALAMNFTFLPQNTTQPYSISMPVGWNSLGMPFSRSMPINALTFTDVAFNDTRSYQDAVAAGWLDPVVWSHNSQDFVQVSATTLMEPFAGYFMNARRELRANFSPGGGDPSGLARLVRKPDPVLAIHANVFAQDEDGADLSAPQAALGLRPDPQFAGLPPWGEDEPFVSVFMTDPDGGGRLASLYQAPAAEATWRLTARTNVTGPVRLVLTVDRNLNKRWDLQIEDPLTGQIKDLTHGLNEITFEAPGGVYQRVFRVTAKSNGAGSQSVAHRFEAGWNLVSFPIDAFPAKAVLNLSDDVAVPQIFQYHQSRLLSPGEAEDVDLQAGLGYWLHLDAPADLDVDGAPILPGQTVEVPLAEGWNLLGNPYDQNLPLGDNLKVRIDATGDILPLSTAKKMGFIGHAFTYQEGIYEPADELAPWRAWFIRSRGGVSLIFGL